MNRDRPPATRRRVLRLVAAGAAAALVPGGAAETPHVHWRGRAMGADAALTISDADTARARTALADCVAEIRRLEAVFALRRPDSALASLNAEGSLADPPAALVTVLREAAAVSHLSAGAFDVTVQPLWAVHVAAARRGGDDAAALEAARALVDWRRLAVSAERVAFTAPGMAATLNGIAQGHVTDRIAERLAAHGFVHVLVDVGELRAAGERQPGEAWRIGVAGAGGAPGATTLRLHDRAVATSSPAATPLGRGRHHLFDPASGRPARSWAAVTVVAATAMRADALSTAIAVGPEDAAPAILAAGGGEAARLVDRHGRIVRLRG